ncbi:TBCC domain-containing protein 1 [Merluccius polli]|uniref:TBCC domain-containing protein 1 n=1 Tax=Merluccius polli TaxID=89951 RepID=A0AA47MVY2_MERPO|nr:TBCC domain-containing protein 1 [Merluccius polli]
MEPRPVSIWPRMGPFLLGALQVAPPSKLGLHYLRKMALYVRTRDGCFPFLSWPMWRHIACGKLQLQEELAWLYFETFDLLTARTPEEKLGWAESLSQCSNSKELDHQRSKLSVDTLKFLLFLYIQQLNRVSLRTSLIGEEWPSPNTRSPSPCSKRESKNSSRSKQNWDDQAHLSFVHSHLGELLELLVEPGQLSSSGQAIRDSQVSLEAVQGLSLLLEGSVGHGSEAIHPVHKLLTKAPLQPQAGYSKLSRSFPLQQLLTCLRQNLTVNPFGMTACLHSGKKLTWAQQGKAKIVRNTHMAPAGGGMLLMSQVFQQTLAKDSDKLTGANIKIHRCSHAFIYLLSPLRSVSVDKCRNCTLVLGPVETCVHIDCCEDVRVACVAGRVSIGASSRCTIHTLTPTRPLLLPGNKDITLGPFHTHYPTLEDHMGSAGLAVVPNVWDQPLLLGTDGLAVAHSLNSTSSSTDSSAGCYRLLPPSDFSPLVVPFTMEGDTCEVPGGLPPAYQAALAQKEKRIRNMQRIVSDSQLNEEQQCQFQELVTQHFLEWLREMGHIQELSNLAPQAQPGQEPSNGPSADSGGQAQPRVNEDNEARIRHAVGQTQVSSGYYAIC